MPNSLIDTFTALIDDIYWTGYAETLANDNPAYFNELLNDYLTQYSN